MKPQITQIKNIDYTDVIARAKPVAILRLLRFTRNDKKGQAFAEFIIALIVLPLFITGTITIARMFIVNMRLHQAARHGAFLMATQRVTKTNMLDEVKKYFSAGYPKFETSKIKIVHKSKRVGLIKGDEVTVSYTMKVFDLSRLSFWKGTPKIEKRFTQSAVCGRAAF
ncbi:MAG: pilus assembly protein [Elusimicrobia bacterium]|nr:pilus assembly protein [Elusimicrobiota bacterium]